MSAHKVYCCGRAPLETDPSNGGEISFYNTPEACSDSESCTDGCGVIEADLVFGGYVPGMEAKKETLTAEQAIAEEKAYTALAARLEALLAGESEETAHSALVWGLAGRKRAKYKARGEARRKRGVP